MTDGVEITDEMLLAYSDEVYEKDDSRPVLIEPGVYSAELVDWSKQFSPQFRKFTLVMHLHVLHWFGSSVLSTIMIRTYIKIQVQIQMVSSSKKRKNNTLHKGLL